jgi:hypothetical protein
MESASSESATVRDDGSMTVILAYFAPEATFPLVSAIAAAVGIIMLVGGAPLRFAGRGLRNAARGFRHAARGFRLMLEKFDL